MNIKLTAVGSYRVWRNRVLISEHKTEREAVQKAIEVKHDKPDADVTYDNDYRVDVEEA